MSPRPSPRATKARFAWDPEEAAWWTGRLDALKAHTQWSDARVARRLQISPAQLSHVRTGHRPLPMPARVRLLHALGYVYTQDLFLTIMPAEFRDAVRAWDARRIGDTGSRP